MALIKSGAYCMNILSCNIYQSDMRLHFTTKFPPASTTILSMRQCSHNFTIYRYMLIDLTQQGTRCSNGPGKAQKQLISGASSIEAKAELIHIALQMNASAVVGSQ